jgi:N-carbamoylputrescine amidase
MKYHVALLQISPVGANSDENLEKGITAVRKAKELGGDVAVFPELWSIGCTPCPLDARGKKRWEQSALDQRSRFFQEFQNTARNLSINIALTYLEEYSPKPRNSVFIINSAGELVLNYSKVFICDFGQEELLKEHPNEDEIGCDFNCTPGNTFDVCALQGIDSRVKVGAMICADREFPESAARLALNGAELILVPNACSWDDIRTALLKARAFENFVGIAVANYPAPRNNGNSQAYDCVAWLNGKPRDTLVAHADENEQILIASFDMDLISDFRKKEEWRLTHKRHWSKRGW